MSGATPPSSLPVFKTQRRELSDVVAGLHKQRRVNKHRRVNKQRRLGTCSRELHVATVNDRHWAQPRAN
jgi:hypothetical protein